MKTHVFHVSFQQSNYTDYCCSDLTFYAFLSHFILFYIFVQWSCNNCDSVTLKIHFCNNNNNNNNDDDDIHLKLAVVLAHIFMLITYNL